MSLVAVSNASGSGSGERATNCRENWSYEMPTRLVGVTMVEQGMIEESAIS